MLVGEHVFLVADPAITMVDEAWLLVAAQGNVVVVEQVVLNT